MDVFSRWHKSEIVMTRARAVGKAKMPAGKIIDIAEIVCEKTRMAKQLVFPGFEKLMKADFGGDLLKGNAREQRPISNKRPMHLVMRSTLATGERSFLNARKKKASKS